MIIEIPFTPPDMTEVVDALARGAQWVNLQPAIDPAELPPPRSFVVGLFGNQGPLVPFCTWHRGERMAGIQHASGPKLVRRIDVPAGWRVTQDHPKRGLVVEVPGGVGDAEVLGWLVRVAAPLGPTADLWVAEVHA